MVPVFTSTSLKGVEPVAGSGSLLVVCLCAAWCDTCNEFRAAFERIAEARPQMLFLWLDIEDDAELVGETDVENFPTLAIYRGDAVLHFGVSLPQEATVARLVNEMARRQVGVDDAPIPVRDLASALRRQVGWRE
ncbi:MAG TPA: thioredoxin family protein [Casimicrobiaceae bacterium]|nr:thioredoxin family protein [Casimicrobiaceae bacterium]